MILLYAFRERSRQVGVDVATRGRWGELPEQEVFFCAHLFEVTGYLIIHEKRIGNSLCLALGTGLSKKEEDT